MTPSGNANVASSEDKLTNNVLGASVVLSAAANASATLLIGFKFWCANLLPIPCDSFINALHHRTHRKFMNKNLGPRQGESQVLKVLALLVESGVVYFGLQVRRPVRSQLVADVQLFG